MSIMKFKVNIKILRVLANKYLVNFQMQKINNDKILPIVHHFTL